MNWLKNVFGSKKQNIESELFPNLALEEKRKLLALSPLYLESIRSGRSGTGKVVNLDSDEDFINRMTDNELVEAIDLTRLARDASSLGDHKEAIRVLEQIVAKAPFDSISIMSIGTRYGMLGNRHKAVQYIEKALQSDPHNERISKHLDNIRNHFKM